MPAVPKLWPRSKRKLLFFLVNNNKQGNNQYKNNKENKNIITREKTNLFFLKFKDIFFFFFPDVTLQETNAWVDWKKCHWLSLFFVFCSYVPFPPLSLKECFWLFFSLYISHHILLFFKTDFTISDTFKCFFLDIFQSQ